MSSRLGAVHVLHDEEVQVAVLIDVVGADDVGVIEAAGGPGLAVEAAECGGSSAFAGGSTFTATRRRMNMCSHRNTWPMPPKPSVSRSLYLPIVKPRHLPSRNCSAWK